MVTQKETKEKEKSSRENLGKLFYDLAKTSYAAMVLGGIVPLFDKKQQIDTFPLMCSGIVLTFFFIMIGYYIFKKK